MNRTDEIRDKDSPFARFQCPYCTWFRARTCTATWERSIIVHPTYGRINNFAAYIKDVARHDCIQTYEARRTHGFDPNRRYESPYEQRVQLGRKRKAA